MFIPSLIQIHLTDTEMRARKHTDLQYFAWYNNDGRLLAVTACWEPESYEYRPPARKCGIVVSLNYGRHRYRSHDSYNVVIVCLYIIR